MCVLLFFLLALERGSTEAELGLQHFCFCHVYLTLSSKQLKSITWELLELGGGHDRSNLMFWKGEKGLLHVKPGEF